MKKLVKSLAALASALVIGSAFASEAGYPLDHFPTEKLTQEPSLQHFATCRGAG